MMRAMMNKKKIEYTIYCNQGTPDVFVNGRKVGTVKNGVCKWKDVLYDSDKTISIANNIMLPQAIQNTYRDNVLSAAHGSGQGGLLCPNNWSIDIPYRTGYCYIYAGDIIQTTSFLSVMSGILKQGNNSLELNYTTNIAKQVTGNVYSTNDGFSSVTNVSYSGSTMIRGGTLNFDGGTGTFIAYTNMGKQFTLTIR